MTAARPNDLTGPWAGLVEAFAARVVATVADAAGSVTAGVDSAELPPVSLPPVCVPPRSSPSPESTARPVCCTGSLHEASHATATATAVRAARAEA